MPANLTQEVRFTIDHWSAGITSEGLNADPKALLAALAMVESSGGANNVPRHEDGWCPNQFGHAAKNNVLVHSRHKQYGCHACCSYSPWQILYHTAADNGYKGKPVDLTLPGVAIVWVIRRLNRMIDGPGTYLSVEQIGDAWNSGNYEDRIVPVEYVGKLRQAYNEALV